MIASRPILFECRIGSRDISRKSRMVQKSSFEFGVVKLQKSLQKELNENEKTALYCLLKLNVLDASSP